MLASNRDLIITALVVAIGGTFLMMAGTTCAYTNICSVDESNALLGFGMLASIYAAITALSFANLKSVGAAAISLILVGGAAGAYAYL